MLVIFNAGDEMEVFALPEAEPALRWETLIDTADPWRSARRLRAGDRYELPSRSMAVFRLSRTDDGRQLLYEWGPAGTH